MFKASQTVNRSTIVRKALDLVSAERLLNQKDDKNFLVYPAFFLVFNFLVCALFERALKNDAYHLTLPLFLFVEFTLYLISSVSRYQRQMLNMLQKTTIYPVSSTSLYLYSIISDLFRPMAFVFLLTNALFIIVLFHASFFTSALALFFFLLLFLAVEVFFAMVASALQKSAHAGLALSMMVILFVSITLIISLVFHQRGLLSSLPLVSWCSNGIYGACSGDSGIVWLNMLLLVLGGGTFVVIGMGIYRIK
jgi:hypothetical protein